MTFSELFQNNSVIAILNQHQFIQILFMQMFDYYTVPLKQTYSFELPRKITNFSNLYLLEQHESGYSHTFATSINTTHDSVRSLFICVNIFLSDMS